MKVCLTDLPWGKSEVTDYNVDIDYTKVADIMAGHFDRLASMHVNNINTDLANKRARRGDRQEPIIVAMGDGEALGKLRASLKEKNIEVCIFIIFDNSI